LTSDVNHWRRVVLWWLAASVILTPIVVLVLGPGLPPGNGSVQASGQVVDNTVLLAVSTPAALAVIVYFVYALIAFREREPAAVLDGPPIRGNSQIQMWWLIVTTGIVIFLAAYGTIRLLADGSGGGQGPNPIASPAGSSRALQVQVIAQQWKFTYRWPQYGGVETPAIELPANTTVRFNVTSLDVIHSFWAHQLGLKADANPGINNVAYVTTKGPLKFDVRCAELCGVFHGYMFDTGYVVPRTQFATWIAVQQRRFAPATKVLPPYSRQYFPAPTRRA
jgi:cytochrome c oxidase subunit II